MSLYTQHSNAKDEHAVEDGEFHKFADVSSKASKNKMAAAAAAAPSDLDAD